MAGKGTGSNLSQLLAHVGNVASAVTSLHQWLQENQAFLQQLEAVTGLLDSSAHSTGASVLSPVAQVAEDVQHACGVLRQHLSVPQAAAPSGPGHAEPGAVALPAQTDAGAHTSPARKRITPTRVELTPTKPSAHLQAPVGPSGDVPISREDKRPQHGSTQQHEQPSAGLEEDAPAGNHGGPADGGDVDMQAPEVVEPAHDPSEAQKPRPSEQPASSGQEADGTDQHAHDQMHPQRSAEDGTGAVVQLQEHANGDASDTAAGGRSSADEDEGQEDSDDACDSMHCYMRSDQGTRDGETLAHVFCLGNQGAFFVGNVSTGCVASRAHLIRASLVCDWTQDLKSSRPCPTGLAQVAPNSSEGKD